jgi:Flp pilus assembly pilin Flp
MKFTAHSAFAKPAQTQSVPGRQAGQGMTEYLVIVSIVAVAAIGVYSLFGQTLRNQTAGLAMEVAGQDAATAIGNAQTKANAAQGNANVRKGLDNYNLQNRP